MCRWRKIPQNTVVRKMYTKILPLLWLILCLLSCHLRGCLSTHLCTSVSYDCISVISTCPSILAWLLLSFTSVCCRFVRLPFLVTSTCRVPRTLLTRCSSWFYNSECKKPYTETNGWKILNKNVNCVKYDNCMTKSNARNYSPIDRIKVTEQIQ